MECLLGDERVREVSLSFTAPRRSMRARHEELDDRLAKLRTRLSLRYVNRGKEAAGDKLGIEAGQPKADLE